MSKQTKETKKYDPDVKVKDFCGKKKIFFLISLALILISLLSTFTGVDIALEFKGGTIITYSYVGEMDASTIEKEVGSLVGSSVRVQQGDSLDGDTHTLSLSFSSNDGLTADRQAEVTDKISSLYPDGEVEVLDSNDVDARSGSEFFAKCIVAAVFAALILIVYIAFRFKQISGWSAGVCAVLGLLSTLIVTYGSVVLLGFEIDSNFMAVILTLLGYAVNDTIVIYDRIRENQSLLVGVPIEELVNISNSQSLRRSLRTSITTFGSMLVVTIVALAMGLDSILSFSVPMMFGIAMGTFNSIALFRASGFGGRKSAAWMYSSRQRKLQRQRRKENTKASSPMVRIRETYQKRPHHAAFFCTRQQRTPQLAESGRFCAFWKNTIEISGRTCYNKCRFGEPADRVCLLPPGRESGFVCCVPEFLRRVCIRARWKRRCMIWRWPGYLVWKFSSIPIRNCAGGLWMHWQSCFSGLK